MALPSRGHSLTKHFGGGSRALSTLKVVAPIGNVGEPGNWDLRIDNPDFKLE